MVRRVTLSCFSWKRTRRTHRLPPDGSIGSTSCVRPGKAFLLLSGCSGTSKDEAKAVLLAARKKPQFDRVIYKIDEQRWTVWVLTIRHIRSRHAKKSDPS